MSIDRTSRLQTLASDIAAASDYFSHLEECRAHDPVRKLTIPKQGPTGGITDYIEICMGIVQLKLPFRRAGLLGIKIKDSHFNVKGDSKFVPFQKNDGGPGRVQVVEDATIDKGNTQMKSDSTHEYEAIPVVDIHPSDTQRDKTRE